MTTIIAKVFIILTLVFEVITITTGPALYPVFAASCGIVFGCLVLQVIIAKVQKISNEHKAVRKMFGFPLNIQNTEAGVFGKIPPGTEKNKWP